MKHILTILILISSTSLLAESQQCSDQLLIKKTKEILIQVMDKEYLDHCIGTMVYDKKINTRKNGSRICRMVRLIGDTMTYNIPGGYFIEVSYDKKTCKPLSLNILSDIGTLMADKNDFLQVEAFSQKVPISELLTHKQWFEKNSIHGRTYQPKNQKSIERTATQDTLQHSELIDVINKYFFQMKAEYLSPTVYYSIISGLYYRQKLAEFEIQLMSGEKGCWPRLVKDFERMKGYGNYPYSKQSIDHFIIGAKKESSETQNMKVVEQLLAENLIRTGMQEKPCRLKYYELTSRGRKMMKYFMYMLTDMKPSDLECYERAVIRANNKK